MIGFYFRNAELKRKKLKQSYLNQKDLLVMGQDLSFGDKLQFYFLASWLNFLTFPKYISENGSIISKHSRLAPRSSKAAVSE